MDDKKEFLAYKDKAKLDPRMGFVKPLALIEKTGSQKFIKLDTYNFEGFENNVIIFDNYDNIDSLFENDEIFKIKVHLLEKKDIINQNLDFTF